MTEGKSNIHWPGTDEKSVVEEMLLDRDSKQWEECSKFVKRCVHIKAKNIPSHLQDEISQEIMYKVTKHLPNFHFECTLKTWLNTIIQHCIIDTYRKRPKEGHFNVPLGNLYNESDHEGEVVMVSEIKSAEDVFETNDDVRHALSALLEYTNAHSNPIRNRLIIKMVIFEGYTHVEAAKAAGCNAPVVSYVIREAQRYAREKMEHKT
jgi:RNA polymerase sigma factor (sigma-70 family)